MFRPGLKKFIIAPVILVVFLSLVIGILILKLPETEMVRDSVQAELSRFSGNRVAIGTIRVFSRFSFHHHDQGREPFHNLPGRRRTILCGQDKF